MPPLESIVLVTYAFGRERAATLLEGLAPESAQQALALLQEIVSLPSNLRQARTAVSLGLRPNADQQLVALMSKVPPLLQREIYRLLPHYYRSRFKDFPEWFPTEPEATSLMLQAWAARLIKEATH